MNLLKLDGKLNISIPFDLEREIFKVQIHLNLLD